MLETIQNVKMHFCWREMIIIKCRYRTATYTWHFSRFLMSTNSSSYVISFDSPNHTLPYFADKDTVVNAWGPMSDPRSPHFWFRRQLWHRELPVSSDSPPGMARIQPQAPAALLSQLLPCQEPSLAHSQQGLEGENYSPWETLISRGGSRRRVEAPVVLIGTFRRKNSAHFRGISAASSSHGRR